MKKPEIPSRKDMAMIRCPSCGQEIGMNGRCRDCLSYMVSEKSGTINVYKAEEILKSFEAWESGEGAKAPARLRTRAVALAGFVRAGLEGSPAVEWGAAARAAFALHYTVSPADWTPDSIPGAGWQDDETVLDIVITSEKPGILEYCKKTGADPGGFGLA